MRLRRLDLARYGKFTDRVIDFGERPADGPDLHVVYGPNEAGKSTAFAAFLDLLFGIDARSRYNFLHPYPAMRVGASLELSGVVRELARIKRPQRSLLDAAGQPLQEGVLAGELGGIDRASYRTMFSLDDETLEAGGESILASKGDLGQLLFSASAGLADLARTLVDLRAEADRFYKFHARGGELSAMKDALAGLKARRDEIDTLASTYMRLMEARDLKASQYETALAERGRIRLRMDEVQRNLNALPRMAALRDIGESLEALAGLAEPPPGWVDILPGLRERESEFKRRGDGIEGEISLITSELEGMVVDETALRLADRLDRLAELRARAVTADLDIPARRRELGRVERDVSATLMRLGRVDEPDPAVLLIDAGLAAELRELIATRSGIAAEARSAAEEQGDAVHRLAQSQAAYRDAGGGEGGAGTWLAAVRGALESVRGSDHAARRKLADRTARQHREAMAQHVAALLPWRGVIEELAALRVPADEVVGSRATELRELRGLIDARVAEAARIDAERTRREAELSASKKVAGVVSDEEAAAIRGAREAAWAEHRLALDAELAVSFEATLRRDDVVTGARFGHERQVAKLHEAEISVAGLLAQGAGVQKLLADARARESGVQAEIVARAKALSPEMADDITPERLQAWLDLRLRALEAWNAVRGAEREARDATEDAASAHERLLRGLQAAAVPHDAAAELDSLVAAAQAALDREARLAARHEAVAACERDVATRERAVQKASAADRRWIARWTQACAACWLGGTGTPPAPEAVGDVLVALGELAPALTAAAGLAGRIEDMERDLGEFEREVGELGAALEPAVDSGTLIERARQIADRIAAAETARARVVERSAALAAARLRREQLAQEMSAHAEQAAGMMAFFGVASLAEVADRLKEAERKAELQARRESAEREIREALRMASVEAAKAVLDAADQTALELEAGALALRFDEQDRHARELFAAEAEASSRLAAVGGDDAVAAIEEKRRTILLDIEDRSLRYLRLRAGIAAAEQALRAYRDKHRSSMMARASDAFRLLSRGAYQRLSTRPEKDADVLIAVGEDGSKLASDLSKGTRFQLYLALRAAGYYEYAQARPPVPFIADDIMETFDDFRAEEAFRLFAEMAGLGQVIYLTHHRHLCDIARQVAPGLRVHELA